jgi:hypothetical protein
MMTDPHPYAKGTYRRAQHDSDVRDIVIDGLAERHAALLVALDALVADLNTSSRSCLLFGNHDEPLEAEGQRIVRVIANRLAAELAKHREKR